MFGFEGDTAGTGTLDEELHEGVADDDGADGRGGAFELIVENPFLIERWGGAGESGCADDVVESGEAGAGGDADFTRTGAGAFGAGKVNEPLDTFADGDHDRVGVEDFGAITFVVEAGDLDERLGVRLGGGEGADEQCAEHHEEESEDLEF